MTNKKDIRKTKAFQKKRAKELGMTLDQYSGKEPIQTIWVSKMKEYRHKFIEGKCCDCGKTPQTASGSCPGIGHANGKRLLPKAKRLTIKQQCLKAWEEDDDRDSM
jgi:hypothetical protein